MLLWNLLLSVPFKWTRAIADSDCQVAAEEAGVGSPDSCSMRLTEAIGYEKTKASDYAAWALPAVGSWKC